MKKTHVILGSIQLFIAIGAIPAATLFLLDTSGAKMGNSVEMLADSPFKSFLIPGLFLLIVNGFGNLTGALLSFRRKKLSGPAGIILGFILMTWIAIQVYWIGSGSFLQPLFFVIGFIEALLGWLITRNIR